LVTHQAASAEREQDSRAGRVGDQRCDLRDVGFSWHDR
jgi:hypothetical protein